MAGPSAPRSPDVVSPTNSSWPPEPGSRPQPVWRRRPEPRWAETSDQQDRPDWKDRVDPAGSAGHRRSEVEELDRELVAVDLHAAGDRQRIAVGEVRGPGLLAIDGEVELARLLSVERTGVGIARTEAGLHLGHLLHVPLRGVLLRQIVELLVRTADRDLRGIELDEIALGLDALVVEALLQLGLDLLLHFLLECLRRRQVEV